MSALAQRHFDRAGQWLRVPAAESSDLASFDFSQCFRAHLQSSWDALHLQARRRAVMGRPFAAWDSGLVQWSDGRWEEWAKDRVMWQALRQDWVAWTLERCGVVGVGASGVGGEALVEFAPRPVLEPHALCQGATFVHLASDSLVLCRVLQGRWRAKQPWLCRLGTAANDCVFEV